MATLTRGFSLALSDQEVIATLMLLAGQHPDRVYEKPEDGDRCLYFHGDEPGCIIGHLMSEHGVRASDLTDQSSCGYAGATINGDGIGGLCDAGRLQVSARAADLMARVQDRQDQGETWFDAVYFALAEVER